MGQDSTYAAEQATIGSLALGQVPGTVITLGAAGVIPSNTSSVRVTATAARAGIIIAPGTRPGQILVVHHEGVAANTLTMDVVATSNVSNGVLCVITGPAMKIFVWDAVTAYWSSLSTS